MNQLDELKQILVGDEQRSIEDLHTRIIDREKRAQDVAEILSDSISISSREGSELIDSLQEPITECIKTTARKDTQIFADALFPVIMPAIRRSIAEALRSFVQSITETMEQSLSITWLRWRLEAIRTGVPFSEVVLKHTLVYRVEEVFYIHRKSGLLISHVSNPEASVKDSDAVSAMFTAIQDFVHDSFGAEDSSELDSIDIGDHTAWLFYSPYSTLACVIRGIAPLRLREQITQIMEDLDRGFGPALERFNGDRTAYREVEPVLEKCLQLELKSSPVKPTRLKRFLVLTVVLLLIIMALTGPFWLRSHLQQTQRFDGYVEALDRSPGIVVLESNYESGKLNIKGLRDPLAVDPMEIAHRFGLGEGTLKFNMSAYQCVEAPIVLARAHHFIDIPSSIQLKLNKRVLLASGTAPAQWVEKFTSLGPFIAGVQRVDVGEVTIIEEPSNTDNTRSGETDHPPITTRVLGNTCQETPLTPPCRLNDGIHGVDTPDRDYPDAESLQDGLHSTKSVKENPPDEIITNLKPPEGIQIQLVGSRLHISGVAPWGWIKGLPSKLETFSWLKQLDIEHLTAAEWEQLKEMSAQISEQQKIYFDEDIRLSNDSRERLPGIISELKAITNLAADLGISTTVKLIGHTDGTGNADFNRALANQRVAAMLQYFKDAGLDGKYLLAGGNIDHPDSGYHSRYRSVSLAVDIGKPDMNTLFKPWLH